MQTKAQILAARLAAVLLETEKDEPDETQTVLSQVLGKLAQFETRFDRLESEIHERREPESNLPAAPHSSSQKFEIPEPVTVFLPHTNIKACAFEPNGKPCDNCSMCSALGF